MITGFCEAILEWLEEKMAVLIVLFIIAAVLIVGGLIAGFIISATSETFTLVKAEWNCTASHEETTTFYNKVGNVMVPMTTTNDVCDKYERRGR